MFGAIFNTRLASRQSQINESYYYLLLSFSFLSTKIDYYSWVFLLTTENLVLSRQGKYWWCWADIYDLVDNPLGLGFYNTRQNQRTIGLGYSRTLLKEPLGGFHKEPAVLIYYLISSHIIRALGSFRNRTDTRRMQRRFLVPA
jgi:hypothetical protein